jgi:hypothetical protein
METPQPYPFALNPGELLLWSGVPRQGLIFRAADIGKATFGVLFLGFVIWTSLNTERYSPYDFLVWGLLYAVGLHILVGTYFYAAWRRRRSSYAVTSDRILIRNTPVSRHIKSFPLETMTDIGLDESGDGSGNIWMGRRYLAPGVYDGRDFGSPTNRLGFASIPNVRQVYDLLVAAKQTKIALLDGSAASPR